MSFPETLLSLYRSNSFVQCVSPFFRSLAFGSPPRYQLLLTLYFQSPRVILVVAGAARPLFLICLPRVKF